jgi:hypothetical protein
MMNSGDDVSFSIDRTGETLRVVVSKSMLRTFMGRSHVTVGEVLEIYRFELEGGARQGSSQLKSVFHPVRGL